MKNSIIGMGLLSIMMVTSCKVSDMRKGTGLHKVDRAKSSDQTKGKQILYAYIKKNGYDKFSSVNTYQVHAHEHWKGMMGNMGNPWPESKISYVMKFVPDLNDFTNQVKLTSKKKKGDIWGMKKTTSSSYYKKSGEASKRIKEGMMSFNLANYQWWIEFPYRLSQLKNVTYAGVREKDGQKYDLVLATWGNDLKVNKEYDQYLMWFNKATGAMDLVTFTYRNVPMMSPSFMYGTAIFENFNTVNGINIPFSQKFQINGPSKEKKYAHHFTIDKIDFNSFDKAELLN